MLGAGCDKLGGGTETWWVEHGETVESTEEKYISIDGVNYTIASSRFEFHYSTRTSEGDTWNESETDESLPDAGRGEHDRITLQRKGETYYLLLDYRYVDEAGEPMEVQSRMELELVSGTWRDFAAGRDIKARFTDESHERHRAKLEAMAMEFYDQMLRDAAIEAADFMDLDPKQVAVETSVEKFELSNEPFTLSDVAIVWGSDAPQGMVFKAWFEIDR